MGSNSIENYPLAHKKSTKLALVEDLDSCPSDCESGISGAENEQFPLFDIGLIRVHEKEMIYRTIEQKLLSSLGSDVYNPRVEAIHRSDYSNIKYRAKFQSFCIYSKAMEIKNGGNVNVKYAWFGASKNEIDQIVRHGFGFPTNDPTHGHGVYLSPVDHPMESVQSANPDENGLRHMLLCRVILGNTEVIRPGSTQYNPSSEEFDSGVDNSVSPKKYVIWTSRMNTHIMPDFVVSFRASSYVKGCRCSSRSPRIPNSDWMPFPTLITALSKFLPSDALESISKHHSDYKKQKITRHEMIQQVRCIAGDKLLMAIIKSYRGKIKTSRSSSLSLLDKGN